MWTNSTTVQQKLHSVEKQPVFVISSVAKFLELTTVDEWNYVKSSDNPADAGTRGLSANSLRDSPWLKGPSILRTHDWPFKPSREFDIELKATKSDIPDSKQGTSEFLTALSATVIGIAITFEWQKYIWYEKLLRVVAYILRLLPKNEFYPTLV